MKIFPQLFLYNDHICLLKFYQKQKWWKLYNEKSQKLDDFEILTSITSKTTSKTQQLQNLPSGFYFRLHFWNQRLPLIEMNYRLSLLENFIFSNLLACWMLYLYYLRYITLAALLINEYSCFALKAYLNLSQNIQKSVQPAIEV